MKLGRGVKCTFLEPIDFGNKITTSVNMIEFDDDDEDNELC